PTGPGAHAVFAFGAGRPLDRHAGHVVAGRFGPPFAHTITLLVSGSRTVKVVPVDPVVNDTVPPWRFSTIRRTLSSPRPLPSPGGLVVTNGSNSRSRMPAGMPGPSSATSTTTWSPSRAVRSRSVPPPDIAAAALSI